MLQSLKETYKFPHTLSLFNKKKSDLPPEWLYVHTTPSSAKESIRRTNRKKNPDIILFPGAKRSPRAGNLRQPIKSPPWGHEPATTLPLKSSYLHRLQKVCRVPPQTTPWPCMNRRLNVFLSAAERPATEK